jgi:hypothetical protein
MRASKEEKRESISEFLPSVTISGYVSEQDNTKTGASDSNFKPSEQSMNFSRRKRCSKFFEKKTWRKFRRI